jgi:hypothetical protein
VPSVLFKNSHEQDLRKAAHRLAFELDADVRVGSPREVLTVKLASKASRAQAEEKLAQWVGSRQLLSIVAATSDALTIVVPREQSKKLADKVQQSETKLIAGLLPTNQLVSELSLTSTAKVCRQVASVLGEQPSAIQFDQLSARLDSPG